MLGVDSADGPTHELADRCRDVRERLLAIAKLIATLRAELDQALAETPPSPQNETGNEHRQERP